jgi:regulatory protein
LRARAMRCLARREYSRVELGARLLPYAPQADDPADPAAEDLESLLDDLVSRGWLSDERAAEQLVHQKRTRFGMLRIAHELRRKGIAEGLIEATLPELQRSELEAARSIWKRKFPAYPNDPKEKARQTRFLQSRGFSLETIFKILDDSE